MVSRVLTVCLIVIYQAQGAPQWIDQHGIVTPILDPNVPMPPPGYGPPIYQRLGPYQQLRINPPINLAPEDISLLENGYSDYLDYSDGIVSRNNVQECNPRAWFRKSRCYNSTTIQSCRFGVLRYIQCPDSWSCNSVLGICLRSLSRVLPTRSFSCPTFEDNNNATYNKIGIYPDPHSCKVYHNCSATNLTTVHCVYPQLYDPYTQSCQMFDQNTPCYRFKCFGSRGAIAYPGDPLIFANCSSRGMVMSVDKCRSDMAFNVATQQCDMADYCRKEGNIQGPTNQTYYTCSRVFKRLVRSELRTCPGILTFDSASGLCALSQLNTSSSTSSPYELRDLDPYYMDDYQQDTEGNDFLLPGDYFDFPVNKRSAVTGSPPTQDEDSNSQQNRAPYQSWNSINTLFMR